MRSRGTIARASLLALATALIAGCGAQASGDHPDTSPLIGGASTGYLASTPDSVLFLQVTANGTAVTGMLSVVETDKTGARNASGPISGTLAGSNLTMWTSDSWLASLFAHAAEGTANGSTLTLVYQPEGTTSLMILHLHAATAADYNRATSKLLGR